MIHPQAAGPTVRPGPRSEAPLGRGVPRSEAPLGRGVPRSEAPPGRGVPRSEAPLGRAARGLIFAIRVYQGLRAGRPSPCRFFPSCSAYGVEAVERHGAVRGTWLTLRRLSRCRPWGGSGHDPVPD